MTLLAATRKRWRFSSSSPFAAVVWDDGELNHVQSMNAIQICKGWTVP